jgi:glycosyltransferase involved in cell wall biosynthesis
MKNILIVGKVPPPIGGVRIHVQRLIQELEKRRYPNYQFYNLEQKSVWKLLIEIPNYRVVHLHTSSTWFQFLLSIYCRCISKPLIITYHSSWGRYSSSRNLLESFSARIATVPVVQNTESLIRARRYNPRSLQMSSFIPPFSIVPLPATIYEQIMRLKKSYTYVFCTNAWNLTFDKAGLETYGISSLIKKFESYRQSALIISDPSGNYQRYAQKKSNAHPNNVYWISEPHDFWNVLTLSDAFIRNTTTDGTSLSIQEAFRCNTQVFATDCVSRPEGCIRYSHLDDINLEEKMTTRAPFGNMDKSGVDTVEMLIKLYERWLVRLYDPAGRKNCVI